MNQICKVCGEPAAGFHFGAFTCEGCKSFFGRSYNNVNSISECKNNNKCIINKKNRTACKACRLLKCLKVGMSKSGSRYGRRSNWFKIHCLLAEQQQQQDKQHQQQQQQQQHQENSARSAENNVVRGEIATTSNSSSNNTTNMVLPTQMLTYNPSSLFGTRHEDLIRMRMETHFQQHFQHHHHHHQQQLPINNNNNNTSSPSVSSPESSHNSESSSVDFNNETTRRIPLMQNLLPPFIPHPSFFIPQYALYQSGLLPSPVGFPASSHNPHNNNNNEDSLSIEKIPKLIEENSKANRINRLLEITQKRINEDAASNSSTPERRDDDDDEDDEDEEVDAVKTPVPTPCLSPIQDTPIDLSMRSLSDRSSSSPSAVSVRSAASVSSEISDYDNRLSALRLVRSIPVDLTNKA